MAECGAKCVSVCALSGLKARLSTQVAEIVVSFAKCCLYRNAICGYQPCYAHRRVVS